VASRYPGDTDMPKYTRRVPWTARYTSAGSRRSPTKTSAPAARKAAARSSSRRTRARTGSPRSRSRPVTVRPTAPSWPAAPVTRIGSFCSVLMTTLLARVRRGGPHDRTGRCGLHEVDFDVDVAAGGLRVRADLVGGVHD